MKQLITLKINGELHDVAVSVNKTLLEVLREDLGFTGTKKGCDHGECGACTVLINGIPASSCLTLAVTCQGKEIMTIESLAALDKLHPLQESFINHGAIQCGFCTPGMLLVAKVLLDEDPHPDRAKITASIAGNICRCTGYVKIIEAIEAVAARTL